ncbi:MAG: magnesium transporter, partial [Crocinitomicaceae bacterium]|nr:magnesium transporter [Crocinitomicaceae bacterium]
MNFKITSEFLALLQEKIEDKDTRWIKKNILELHYADIADIMDCLDNTQAKYVYGLADDEAQADILMEVDEKVRDEFIASLSNKEIAEQLENLESDDAADLLGELPDDQQEDVISKMDDEEAAEVVDLLKYDEDTAGGVMQKELICVNLNWPVNRAIVQLRKQAETVEKVYHIYVVDNDDRFVGVLSLKRLLFANTKTIISDLYQAKNLISVKSSDSLDTVSKTMEKYDLFTIPVLDLQNKLIGRITFDDVVEFIKEEADKDYQMASGLSEKIDSDSSVWRISRARLPWLLIGMIGGVFGAQVISGFEGGIEKVPELAFYIPLIMAMGGNIGV